MLNAKRAERKCSIDGHELGREPTHRRGGISKAGKFARFRRGFDQLNGTVLVVVFVQTRTHNFGSTR